ncbi:uncharacterized protein LOC122837437 [Gambusia affinis]|uniref:uncharacterized protein LOC122837437 n=1 Tax=Gambusia affinis TaxID=33528 RepID=UPI001CDC1B9C|nr:uncharacterized protein LOC122837437 [Gambusia affinis]
MSNQDENFVMDEQLVHNDEDNEQDGGQNNEQNDTEQAGVLQQLSELARRQEEVMTVISSLNTEPTRSYVYVPRERHISPFSGDIDKDGRSVDEFIEEVERVISARNQSAPEQFDFVLSLLRGSALEEVRLRKADGDVVKDLFVYLTDAFGDKRSASQLLQNFYNCKQKEGEDIRDFSYSLSQAFSFVRNQHPNSVANENTVLRDQFIEGIRDLSLRRELRKYVRGKPASTFIEVREEAYLWSLDQAPTIKMARSKVKTCSNVTAEAQCCAVKETGNPMYLEDVMKTLKEQDKITTPTRPNEKSVSIDDVLKVLTEQGKVITELTKAVKELTIQSKDPSSQTPYKIKTVPRFTPDGKPICFKCQTAGHVAKQCPQKRHKNSDESPVSGQSGNERPWLQ